MTIGISGCVFCSACGLGANCNDEIGLQRDDLRGERRQPLLLSARRASIDDEVSTLDPTESSQFLAKRIVPAAFAARASANNAEPHHLLDLLRVYVGYRNRRADAQHQA
jgi:hypothetical protein